ncbi:TetR/AcrR family transcriptional regulator [Tomitella biformata]|uniref:TetR/AcrR family transcriptional regulator n=1 Tax=Tomitella biformata TaxID=630403 RepID=UPI00056FF7ED|nr:TetR/AcrR family transcriptional regulator [Tomitella biformata]
MEEKRTRLSPQARRAQLVHLGTQMLAIRSIDAVSVEEIADQAGVSRGLIFHYFGSKQGFLLAVVRHLSQEMIDATEPDPNLEPLAQLRHSLTAYLDYVTENRDGYVSLLRGSATGDADMRLVFEETRTALTVRVLERVPLIGIPRSARVELAVRGWIAFVEETVITWLREPELSREELLELLNWALPAVALNPQDALALVAATAHT